MMYLNRLELELDDWLDPTLPKLYHVAPGAVRRFQIGTDFTENDPEFSSAPLFPVFTPVMRNGVLILVKN